MTMTNRLAVCLSAFCATWVLLYVLLGSVNPGRSFYSHIAEWLLEDAKGGVPMVHLALPMLMTGSFACLFWKLPSRSPPPAAIKHTIEASLLPEWGHSWIHRLFFVEGDFALDAWAMAMILFPSVVFVALTVYRHMHGNELSLDDQLLVTSNAFGFVAEVVGSILLIPVARLSPIHAVIGWSRAGAVRLHIWAGRIFILAVLVHGSMHIFRWVGLSKERLAAMIIPPAACWSWDDELVSSLEPSCADESTDCTCYAMFRNLAGFGSAVALFVLMLTSMNQVRRKFYRLFYLSHVIAAPLAILLVVLHWNKSILYMAPSLIYYTATSIPSFLERRFQSTSQASTKLLAVELIPSVSKAKHEIDSVQKVQYICLTFEASTQSMLKFQPGYYAQLQAPEISSISHPFTVNAVPGTDNLLRIIVKVRGEFTKKLSNQIIRNEDSISDEAAFPRLHLEGYFGHCNRVGQVLMHDVAVMVAGGIGITPYLSLLHEVQRILIQTPPGTYPTKRIVLLWICRDPNLFDYVHREYLEPLEKKQQQQSRADIKIKCVVYHTSDLTSHCPYDSMTTTVDTKTVRDLSLGTSVAFTPSRFTIGSSRLGDRFVSFLAFSGITWTALAAVWFSYSRCQDEQSVATRLNGIAAILVVGLVVAVIVNLLAVTCFQIDEESKAYRVLTSTETEGSESTYDSLNSSRADIETGGDEYDFMNESNKDISQFSFEEKQGRPSVHEMLNFVDSGKLPGLFTCGPLGLMQDIREHTEERRMIRLRQCIPEVSPRIALYEEAFNM